MTTPDINIARDRLNRSIANTQSLRRRISRSATELRGEIEEPSELTPTVEQEAVNIDVVGDVGGRTLPHI